MILSEYWFVMIMIVFIGACASIFTKDEGKSFSNALMLVFLICIGKFILIMNGL